MAITAERRETGYLMTDMIGERSLKYTQHINSPSLAEIAKQRPLRFVFVAGAAPVNNISLLSTYEFETIYTDTHAEAYRMLADGRADAFFDKGVAEAEFELMDQLVVQVYFPIINLPIALTTRKTELEPVISVMQKALQDDGFRAYLKMLYENGESDFTKHRLLSQLTDNERAYIRDNPVIPVVAEHYNYPISFYDNKAKQWSGIYFDVLAEVERFTGLKFELVNDEKTEWVDLLRMLEGGDAYVVSELLPTAERQGRFLWASKSLLTEPYSLISKTDAPNISLKEVMNKKIGVQDGTAYAELFSRWFPSHHDVTIYDNPNEAFEAVDNGEIDMVMSSLRQLLTLTNYQELSGYKSNIIFDEQSESIIGFHMEQAELVSIVNKVMGIIDMDDISSNWTEKTYDYQERINQIQFAWFTVVIVILFVLSAVVYFRMRKEGDRLEKLVAMRTRELEQQNVTMLETSSQLEAALVLANEASKAKSNFLSNVSHEIRTPLNAITGMTSIGKSTPEPQRKDYAFEKIEVASKHLLGIINDVLDISKIEAGKFIISYVEFNVEALLRKIADVNMIRIEERNLKFTLSVDERIPPLLWGDDQRLAQVITNFLSNAVKFTPEGMDISVEAVLESEDTDICHVRFSVADSGIGISEEQQMRIFTPFEQAENDTTRKYGGTGLGLSISKHIIEQMGGTINLKSELGKGSVFYFTIPMEKATGESSDDSTSDETDLTPSFAGFRLLLAEDIEINREIVAAFLEPTKIKIDFAINGAEAVRVVTEAPGRYDIILMDVQMPEMDGLQATRLIRASGTAEASSVPIIALTANAFNEDIKKCLQAGMNAHLSKPINITELIDKLSRFLKKARFNVSIT
jgi:signal transduction histidine kinase/CheY-like chemotaxis protein